MKKASRSTSFAFVFGGGRVFIEAETTPQLWRRCATIQAPSVQHFLDLAVPGVPGYTDVRCSTMEHLTP